LKKRAFGNAPLSFVLLSLAGLLLLSGCEDPGVVGNEFVGNDANVVIDTLKVSDFDTTAFQAYSGGFPYFSAGEYNDPDFGDVKAVGLIRPTIQNAITDTIDTDAKVYLSLITDPANVYGDTTASNTFDLVEIGGPWRAREVKYDSDIPLSANVLVSDISIGMEDSVAVQLPDSWVQKYRDYVNGADSLKQDIYQNEYFGFALVPTNTSKIIAFKYGATGSRTRLYVDNPSDTTLSYQIIKDHASLVSRSNEASPSDSISAFYSTQARVFSMSIPFNADSLGSQNLSRVELVLRRAHEEMSLPENNVRPPSTGFDLYYLNPQDIPFTLYSYSPGNSANIDSTDYSFRFNMTSHANSVIFEGSPNTRIIGVVKNNNGIIHSELLYNVEAALKEPKILLTTVKSGNTSN